MAKALGLLFQDPLEDAPAEIEQARFHGAAAAQAPGGLDQLVDQVQFDGGRRLKLVLVGVQEFVEVVAVLQGDDSVLGGEAVAEGVEADGGASLGGFGTVAEAAVAAVGLELTFR